MWHQVVNGSATSGYSRSSSTRIAIAATSVAAQRGARQQVEHGAELMGQQLGALDLARCSTASRGGGRARAARRPGRRTRAGTSSTAWKPACSSSATSAGSEAGSPCSDLAGGAGAQDVGGRGVVRERVALARLRPAVAADVLDAVLAGHDARDRRVVAAEHRGDHLRHRADVVDAAHAREQRDHVAERRRALLARLARARAGRAADPRRRPRRRRGESAAHGASGRASAQPCA